MTNDVFGDEEKHFVTLWFEAEHVGGEASPVACAELTDVGWFSRRELPQPPFLPFEQFLKGRVLRV